MNVPVTSANLAVILLALTSATVRGQQDNDSDLIARVKQQGVVVVERRSKDSSSTSAIIHRRSFSAETLTALRKIKSLKDLGVANVSLSSDMVKLLSDNSNLEVLSFMYCSFDNNGLEELKNLNQLKTITLDSASGLRDEHLKAFARFKTLNLVSIANCRITWKGLNELRTLENLAVMIVDRCDLKDDLSLVAGDFARLESLYLFDCRVGEIVCKAISKMPRLRHITLDGTDVTDDSLRQLAANGSIKSISVKRTKVSRQGVENVRRMHPAVTISAD